jgi:hypothetical protein
MSPFLSNSELVGPMGLLVLVLVLLVVLLLWAGRKRR